MLVYNGINVMEQNIYIAPLQCIYSEAPFALADKALYDDKRGNERTCSVSSQN